jgi:hypothetical protein
MNPRQKLCLTVFAAISALGLSLALLPTPVSAACASGEIEVSVSPGDTGGSSTKCIPEGSGTIQTNPIIVYLKAIINFLAVGVGLVAAISIVIAGFQFMTSRDNPQSVQSAIQRIWNSIIAIALFIFMYAILNFLVPGGLIG